MESRYGNFKGYEEYNNEELRKIRFYESHIRKTDRVLDIGVGNTFYSRFFICKQLFCFDVDWNVIDEASELLRTKQMFQTKGKKVLFFNIDKDSVWNELKNEFDVIILGEIIEHCVNPQQVMLKCFQMLKKDGLLLGSTPNAYNWRRRLQCLFNIIPNDNNHPSNGDHIRFFNHATVKELLEREFKEVKFHHKTPLVSGLTDGTIIWSAKK